MLTRRFRLVLLPLATAGATLLALPTAAQMSPSLARQAGRTQLLEERLTPGKETAMVRSVAVRFQPGQLAGQHRHPVPAFGYVVRGAIRLQIEGEPVKLLAAGQAFHEPAGKTVLHFDNASGDQDAEFVVFYLLGPGEAEVVQMLPQGGTAR